LQDGDWQGQDREVIAGVGVADRAVVSDGDQDKVGEVECDGMVLGRVR
jgi:hypothetical protein